MFLELSEEAIPPSAVVRILRSIAATGAGATRGILFGRPYGEEKTFADYDAALLQVCREFGLESLPLVTQLDFGHTDPIFTVPYGIEAELDCDRQELRYIDACVR